MPLTNINKEIKRYTDEEGNTDPPWLDLEEYKIILGILQEVQNGNMVRKEG